MALSFMCITKALIGRVFIYILMFYPTNFFWNRWDFNNTLKITVLVTLLFSWHLAEGTSPSAEFICFSFCIYPTVILPHVCQPIVVASFSIEELEYFKIVSFPFLFSLWVVLVSHVLLPICCVLVMRKEGSTHVRVIVVDL